MSYWTSFAAATFAALLASTLVVPVSRHEPLDFAWRLLALIVVFSAAMSIFGALSLKMKNYQRVGNQFIAAGLAPIVLFSVLCFPNRTAHEGLLGVYMGIASAPGLFAVAAVATGFHLRFRKA